MSEPSERSAGGSRDGGPGRSGPAAPDRGAALAEDPQVVAELVRRHRPRSVNHLQAGLAFALWAVTALVVALVPVTDAYLVRGEAQALGLSVIFAVLLGVLWLGSRTWVKASRWLGAWSPWWIATAIVLLVWELLTAKTGVLSPPYAPGPGQIIAEGWSDRTLLARSVGNSLLLLAVGIVVGGVTGLATGMWMGWSKRAGYWLDPIVKYIGPVPTLAWIPIVFIAFPNPFSAAVFLVALTVWFPMAVTTSAGIRGVSREYFDVCQTLGASGRFLIFKVSLPAALPNIFTGIFMALPTAFVTLTIAETLGVNSGLGWYINWKKGWSAYPSMYAAIALMVIICGSLLTAELAVRNRVLSWQKDLTRW
ncbi:ABC transporter permease subunit [uncultured Propionibacterium sp.]|uniref:ABC transporter permease n=1 Tax=uncultured Propionibacterium sp. TaxID=218066 RepID=UPI00293167E5|nr:ABC transporter permease subunit [uncultured Propionibacterium sp.]